MNFSSYAATLVPTSGDMSQTQVVAGPIDVRFRGYIAVAASYTGSPVGTLQLLGTTLVPAPSTPPTSGWNNMGSAISVSAAGSYLWDIIGTGCLYLAVLYIRSSGSGTLAVNVSAKTEP